MRLQKEETHLALLPFCQNGGGLKSRDPSETHSDFHRKPNIFAGKVLFRKQPSPDPPACFCALLVLSFCFRKRSRFFSKLSALTAKSLKTLKDATNEALVACAAHITAHASNLLKNFDWLAKFGAAKLPPWRVLTPLSKTDGAVDNGPGFERATAKMRRHV